jgi:hypothetical protein
MVQAVTWLLSVAPEVARAVGVAEHAVQLPSFPPPIAEQLLSNGLRISYAQLVAAADDKVAGVEVWVQAQQKLGIQGDIPAAAVAICCGSRLVSLAER